MQPIDDDQMGELLAAWNDGEDGSRERLIEAIYPELRRLAAFHLANRPGEVSWQATELAHELYFKLLGQKRMKWQNREQLLAVLSQLFRRLLVDEGRRRRRQKRGAGKERVPLDNVMLTVEGKSIDVVALDRALTELAKIEPTAARVAEILFLVGLTHDEAASALGIGRATVGRHWRFARAWLHKKLFA